MLEVYMIHVFVLIVLLHFVNQCFAQELLAANLEICRY